VEETEAREILVALGVTGAHRVTPISGGWDTLIWRVEDATATYALRVFRPDQTAQCQREQSVMAAAASADLPVPAVHASTVWRERPALLLSWCSGRTLLDEVVARPTRVWRLGVRMGELHARIHAARMPSDLRERLPDWIARAGDAELALQARLSAISGTSDALLHLDYHPLNVMTANGALTGVLDWANATVGDPRADFARTVSLLRLAPLPPDAPVVLGVGLRLVLETAWRAGYRRAAGKLEDLAPFYAWAGSMMARDLEPKLGRPGVWLRRSDLARMRSWTATWKRRASLKV
jgi:aminoglycoside phosphotransferase (APT) family kinase protein